MAVDPTQITDKVVDSIFNNFDVWLNAQFLNNDFLVAGIFTVLASFGLYTARNLPIQLWNAIKKRCTYTLTVNSDNRYYNDFVIEVNKNSYNFISRTKSLDGKKIGAGFGRTFSIFRGHFVIADRSEVESDAGKFKQKIDIVFPFISYNNLQERISEFLFELTNKNQTKTKVWTLNDGYLYTLKEYHNRDRNSIFTSEKILSEIEKKIDRFQNSKQWYKDKGIPYKYAILLHGPPGTGKTTLAKYIASYSDRDMIISTPEELPHLTKQIHGQLDYDEDDDIQKPYLCLMEDIDCYNITNNKRSSSAKLKIDEEKDTKKIDIVNLASLLNAIDGLNSPEDLILIATTNHIENIDPALIRKGRFDDVIFIGLLEDYDIKRMISFYVTDQKFLKEIEDLTFSPITGANLQDILINYWETPDKILDNLPTLTNIDKKKLKEVV